MYDKLPVYNLALNNYNLIKKLKYLKTILVATNLYAPKS